MATEVEPEDILASSLQVLYAYTPVTFWGDVFVYKRLGCVFESPKPGSANWGLHAASIWTASLFLADHIDEVVNGWHGEAGVHGRKEILELGAGSGMPGIVLAKEFCSLSYNGDDIGPKVTLSDYPDPSIIACLQRNIARNNIPAACIRVAGHVWGDRDSIASLGSNSFDTIMAADTLWNPELHMPFCQTLQMTLKKSLNARVCIAAGLHTGRWTIQSFIQKLTQFAFLLESITERFVGASPFSDHDLTEGVISSDSTPSDRNWVVERPDESESDRRQWIIWMIIKWDPAQLTT